MVVPFLLPLSVAARVARVSPRPGPLPAPPRACSSAFQEPRRPIDCSTAAQDVLLRRPSRAPPNCLLRRRAPPNFLLRRCPGCAPTPPNFLLCRRPGRAPPPPRTCAADIPSRHPRPAPPPPRTCARRRLECLDRELPPRLDPKLSLAGLELKLELLLLLLPCSCCRPELPCSSAFTRGPLLVLLPVRRSTTGLLAFSSPVPELYLAPSISSTSTPRRNTGLGPVPCSSSYLCCCR